MLSNLACKLRAKVAFAQPVYEFLLNLLFIAASSLSSYLVIVPMDFVGRFPFVVDRSIGQSLVYEKSEYGKSNL